MAVSTSIEPNRLVVPILDERISAPGMRPRSSSQAVARVSPPEVGEALQVQADR